MDAAKADAGLTLKILRLRAEDGSLPPMPALATEGAAGFDVCAFIREPVTVAPGGLVQIPTGLVLELPRYAVEEVERTTDTARGAGGFGSTGR